MITAKHPVKMLLGLSLMAVAALMIAPFFGGFDLPFSVIWGDATRMESLVFWQMRVPQVLVAFLAGAGLSVSGMAFQAMFRNPLATPFTLGVASGASLGAALYLRSGVHVGIPGIPGVSVAAFLGAFAAIVLVYSLTTGRRKLSGASILLAGVAVSFCCSSLLLFVQYISKVGHSIRIMHWLMGGMQVFGYADVFNVLPFVVSGAAVLLYYRHELNLLVVGDDIAASRGVAVGRVKLILFFATSFTVAGVVAVCGPIGFVGMMMPHIARLIIGADHRVLTPASLLAGGIFLVLCDRLARTIVPPSDIPVGVVTALLGGPFFLWLLIRRGGTVGG